MPIPGLATLKRLPRRLRNRFAPGGLILMYHRVIDATPDPWGSCVPPERFAEQMRVLRQSFRPVPLRELTAGHTPRAAPPPVAITFDDGYADNLHTAAPLLEREDIPATVFVTSDGVGREGEFWADDLERLLLLPGNLPRRIRLAIDGRALAWDLGEDAHYDTYAFDRHRSWKAFLASDPTARHGLYRELYGLLQPMAEGTRERVLQELRQQAGVGPGVRATHRFLSPDELRSLAARELIEIGGHTATHPKLSRLSADDQRDEITRGKLALEGALARPITSFAYPYGDHGPETPSIVRQAGFSLACTTRHAAVRLGSDPFRLPRVWVGDWSAKEFAARLRQWLD
ncbi:MAG: polysaccharide deacetylase family protein [Gammaproteobacteria bacterium]